MGEEKGGASINISFVRKKCECFLSILICEASWAQVQETNVKCFLKTCFSLKKEKVFLVRCSSVCILGSRGRGQELPPCFSEDSSAPIQFIRLIHCISVYTDLGKKLIGKYRSHEYESISKHSQKNGMKTVSLF